MNHPVVSAITGLAIGDALGWESLYHNARSLPSWLGRIRREIEADMKTHNSTSLPKPFSLNQSPVKLNPGPADVTEWATWTAILLLENQGTLTHKILHKAWLELAATPESIHGRISVQAALKNVNAGLTAPQSGHFNPHYFDDAALPRAAVIGATYAAQPEVAHKLAALDASFTQYEDGVWSASAVAHLFSQAGTRGAVKQLVYDIVSKLPPGSLTLTTVMKALDGIDATESSMVKIALFLRTDICNQVYSYGNIAHEILASLLVILRATGGDYEKMLACAALIPTPGGALIALSAALGAVIEGRSASENGLNESQQILRGHSLPFLKGVSVLDIATQIGELAAATTASRIKGK